MAADGVFADLRKLADWFSTSPQRGSLHIERIVQRLGTTAIPLLGRELRMADRRRREAARAALAALADDLVTRARVIAELRAATGDGSDDEVKVSALGLLAELGEKAAAVFSDPGAIQRRSAIALAAQLVTDADVASAADLMVGQLADDDIAQMLEVMCEAEPAAAQRLGAELAVRMDLSAEARERFASVLVQRLAPASDAPDRRTRRSAARPCTVAVLVDASARLVVVASKKIAGERRWRRWAVLIGPSGRIDDCLHEDDATEANDAAPLIASLVADGYRVASSELEHARRVVAAAAVLTARPVDRSTGLTSAYYLGRDLLDLGDAHVPERERAAPPPALVGRAIEETAEALACTDRDRATRLASAESLLALCDPANAEIAAATATLHLAAQPPRAADAVAALERALAAEPEWPLHHWNLAAALHLLGDPSGCFHALRRFVATSAQPTGLYADPDQPARVGAAHRMMAELERTARLTGTSLRRRRKKAR